MKLLLAATAITIALLSPAHAEAPPSYEEARAVGYMDVMQAACPEFRPDGWDMVVEWVEDNPTDTVVEARDDGRKEARDLMVEALAQGASPAQICLVINIYTTGIDDLD
jgi:hypothetical protein